MGRPKKQPPRIADMDEHEAFVRKFFMPIHAKRTQTLEGLVAVLEDPATQEIAKGHNNAFAVLLEAAFRIGAVTQTRMVKEIGDISVGTISRWVNEKSMPPSYNRTSILGIAARLVHAQIRTEEQELAYWGIERPTVPTGDTTPAPTL